MSNEFKKRWSDTVSETDSLAVLSHRISTVEDAVVHMARANDSFATSLEQLVRLDERHTNQQSVQTEILLSIRELGTRVSTMEKSSGFWNLSSKAVWAAMLGMCALTGKYVWDTSATINAQRNAIEQYRSSLLLEDRFRNIPQEPQHP